MTTGLVTTDFEVGIEVSQWICDSSGWEHSELQPRFPAPPHDMKFLETRQVEA